MPNDPQVQLERLPATRFAVLRFSSLAGKTEVNTKIEELPITIETYYLRAIGSVTLAQYDSPRILWFMRLNEVIILICPNP